MKKLISVFLVTASFFLCIYGIGGGKLRSMWTSASLLGICRIPAKNATPAESTTASVLEKAPITITPETSSTIVISEEKPEDAKGEVIFKFISPYKYSNLNYGKIYINNKTGQTIDIESELKTGSKIKFNKTGDPEILIMHTHTTECFLDSEKKYYTKKDVTRTTDNSKNITAVGDVIANQLTAAGFSVLHDKTQHDYPQYNGSYTRSKATVESYLKKYKSIKIVIDLHRDAMPSGEVNKIAPTVEINGKKAAQVMLVMGSQTGTITGHPNWKENLRLALQIQNDLESAFPTFARSMLLKSAKFNQFLTTGSILIEVGTDASTLEQALYSGELVGKILAARFNEMR